MDVQISFQGKSLQSQTPKETCGSNRQREARGQKLLKNQEIIWNSKRAYLTVSKGVV